MKLPEFGKYEVSVSLAVISALGAEKIRFDKIINEIGTTMEIGPAQKRVLLGTDRNGDRSRQ